MALRDPNKQLEYNIFGKKRILPKGFFLPAGVSISQNKKSIEKGFKDLEKWIKDPTPKKWTELFGRNNAFGLQLRNYLLGRDDIGSVKGMNSATRIFDELNIKNLISPSAQKKINDLTIGGKGVSLRSIASDTKGNIKYSLQEQINKIKDFQNGNAWLRKNRTDSEIRKYANAIRSMEGEAKKIGGFPFGDNSEKKLWSNLYRASYRGDRIKIVGEFADGNLPIGKDGKIDWKMTNKDGVPAWKRVKFIDTQAPKATVFSWGDNFKSGDLKKQVDNTFGEGFFKKSTEAYDTQVKTGSKRLSSGETIKSDAKIKLLRTEAVLNGARTESEINKYIKTKAPRFNITEVHHPDGVGNNPWKTEPTFRYANRALDKEVMQPLKAGTIDINEAKLRIDKINRDIGPIRTLLDDGYYGELKTAQKDIVKSATKFPITQLKEGLNLKTLDEIPRPEKALLADEFKAFSSRLKNYDNLDPTTYPSKTYVRSELKKVPVEAPVNQAIKDFDIPKGTILKGLAKGTLRAVAPFVPFVGALGVALGVSDVAKAKDEGLEGEELGVAYFVGPELAKKYSDFKDRNLNIETESEGIMGLKNGGRVGFQGGGMDASQDDFGSPSSAPSGVGGGADASQDDFTPPSVGGGGDDTPTNIPPPPKDGTIPITVNLGTTNVLGVNIPKFVDFGLPTKYGLLNLRQRFSDFLNPNEIDINPELTFGRSTPLFGGNLNYGVGITKEGLMDPGAFITFSKVLGGDKRR